MSGKNVHHVGERRLKPIYDSLDNGNCKTAIQEAEKVLKKIPTMACAKVLKALALLRLGKEPDSVEILDSVKKEKPVDECTLQAMTVCYKELNKFNLICEIYEAACEVESKNEDMLLNLFHAYVRVGDYKSQQRTAISLERCTQKTQYRFWFLIILLLQAVPIDELCDFFYPALCVFRKPSKEVKETKIENHVGLKLVDEMVNRLLDKNIIKSHDEILLAIVVKEILKKYNDGLKILHQLQEFLPPDIFEKKKVDLLIKQENWPEVFLTLPDLLRREPDSWCLMQYYLDTLFRLTEDVDKSACMSKFKEAVELINELLDKNRKPAVRGPYLAQMELYEIMKLRDCDPKELLDDIDEMIIEYGDRFHHLSCCSRDVSPYLPLVARDKNTLIFLSEVQKAVGLDGGEMPKNEDQMYYHIFNIELSRMSGFSEVFSICNIGSYMASKCIGYFFHACENLEPSIGTGETRICDRYIMLSVHQLHDLWIVSKDCNYIFEAICVALLGLKESESNRQLKLLLVKLCHIIGAPTAAHKYHKQLDIKHLQIDSLGYIHLWPTLQAGDLDHALDILTSSMKFYLSNLKDNSDYLSMVYKCKTYMKIPDFVNILNCLDKSIHHQLVEVENVLLNIITGNALISVNVDVDSRWDEQRWNDSNLYDTRDMKALWEMNGVGMSVSAAEIEQSEHQDIALLTFRMHLLKIYFILMPIAHSEAPSIDELNDRTKELNKYFSTLQALQEDLSKMIITLSNLDPCPILPKTLSHPPVSRLIIYYKYYFFSNILYQLNFFLGLVQDKNDPELIQNELNRICIYFFDFINKITKNANSPDPIVKKELITSITLYLELVTFSVIVIHALEGIFKLKSTKKPKKKKESATVVEELNAAWKEEMIVDFKETVKKSLKTVDDVIDKEIWSLKNAQIGEIKSLTVDSEKQSAVLSSIAASVNEEIINSHKVCLGQLKRFLNQKEKLLKS